MKVRASLQYYLSSLSDYDIRMVGTVGSLYMIIQVLFMKVSIIM